MGKITKEDVVDAFRQNKRKRNILLYEYYYADYFSADYSAAFIAGKISSDLGLPITPNMIRIARHRIGKLADSSSAHRELKQQLKREILDSLSAPSSVSPVVATPATGTQPLAGSRLPGENSGNEKRIAGLSDAEIINLDSGRFYRLIESAEVTIGELEYIHALVEPQALKMVVYSTIKNRRQKQDPPVRTVKKFFD